MIFRDFKSNGGAKVCISVFFHIFARNNYCFTFIYNKMKKLVLAFGLLLSIAVNGFSYDFSAVCESGQTLYYTIKSASYHRVVVDYSEESSSISGDVILPMFVEHGGTTYTVYGIGELVFYRDTLLNSITLSDSIRYIGYAAFAKCSRLHEVIMGNSVYSIDDIAFAYCSQLESIELPNSLYSIGTGVFKYSGLRSVYIPDSVKEIWDYAFSNCSSLTEIILPDTLLPSIPNGIFENCVNLQRIELPSNFEAIGESAFENCTSLESIYLPNMIDGIGPNAFSGCSSITEIKLILNDGTRVQSSAFYNCSNLRRVVIDVPFNTWSFKMGSEVFKGTGLESITIKCQMVPEITQSTFEGVSRAISIVVPCGLASQYENNGYWSEFTNIQEDLLYSYIVVTEYGDKGTVQVLHEPVSCEDGTLEALAVPQNGYIFIGWLVSDFEYFYWPNPLSVEPFADGPIIAVFNGTGVDENNAIPIEVYPNPTDGVVCVDVDGLERIEVYSITGQFVKEFKSNEIDVSAHDVGTYLLKVFTSSGLVTKQIVKK